MAAILTDVGAVVTNLLATGTSVMTWVSGQPLVLIPVLMSIAFTGFGVVKMFVRHV